MAKVEIIFENNSQFLAGGGCFSAEAGYLSIRVHYLKIRVRYWGRGCGAKSNLSSEVTCGQE